MVGRTLNGEQSSVRELVSTMLFWCVMFRRALNRTHISFPQNVEGAVSLNVVLGEA